MSIAFAAVLQGVSLQFVSSCGYTFSAFQITDEAGGFALLCNLIFNFQKNRFIIIYLLVIKLLLGLLWTPLSIPGLDQKTHLC